MPNRRTVRPTAEQSEKLRAAVKGRSLAVFARRHHSSPIVVGKILDGALVDGDVLAALLGRLA